MTTIKKTLLTVTEQLKPVTATPQLEAELLLSKLLNCERSYLLAWPEKILTSEQLEELQKLSQRRLNGEPIAYILGYKEFWSLKLQVTPDTLIPRPETELLVELALAKLPAEQELLIADLGTGSGAIALALASERPHWQIIATDISAAALTVAKANAKQLAINNITFHQGKWCEALPTKKFSAIISNPPYIAEDDPHLQTLQFEPHSALVAENNGLAAIAIIITQTKNYLLPHGLLMLEHGYEQATQIADLLKNANYHAIEHHADLAGHLRITTATI